ncbi:GntR family transcriptional regulator [Microbacterium suaedae]|uniref:GntR family transcriptional regulator n=1 Tax=Microbacterium suaedae TaxID=2067813 RepID=UPI000DA13A4C|nr:GntR family transcriptional regulator [Microbacterium suaedae]
MLIRVDDASSVPLGIQIAVQIRRSIATGELDAGERLPPAREVASDLDVNLHTVLRAYGMLRDEGLIEMRRGRGTRVCAEPSPAFVELSALIDQTVQKAATLGLSRQQIMDIMASHHSQLGGVVQHT